MLSHPSDFLRVARDPDLDNSMILDWLEATSLFLEEELSQTDVVDHLVQEQVFEDQDSASELVLAAWTALQRRMSWIGSHAPIVFNDRWMTRRVNWQDVPAHSYCLLVSLGSRYEDWHTTFGPNYVEQGRLFESITRAAMEARFSGWRFLQTGWSRDNTSKLASVIDELTVAIDERRGDPEGYLDLNAKDAGVDLVWHLRFPDSRGGTPVYLTQCASGKNWAEKVNEPDIKEWVKIVDFAAPPNKALSLPFALNERELRRQSNRAGGLLVDRYRLLAQATPELMWIPGPLRLELINWLDGRIAWLTSK